MSEKRKVRSDASKLPESSDPEAIRKQVEFYFSDSNLPRDKFLWNLSQKDHGWVPLAVVHNFARMRRFQPLTAVEDALKESELLELSEDKTKLRRREALREPGPDTNRKAFERTVYAKGFGDETETSQFDIEAFFEEFGTVKQVRLRRTDDGSFKSSVFAEFEVLEDAVKFLEESRSYKEQELLIMSKQAYVDMKAAEHGFVDRASGKRRFNAFKDRKKRRRPDGPRDHARSAKSAKVGEEPVPDKQVQSEAESGPEPAEKAAEEGAQEPKAESAPQDPVTADPQVAA